MISKYKQFLLNGNQKVTPFGILNALRCTFMYYKQRSRLKSKHKLRIYNIPYLAFLQIKQDSYKKRKLTEAIINQYKLEKNENLEDFIKSSGLNSKFNKLSDQIVYEYNKIREEGFQNYLLKNLSSSRRHLAHYVTPENFSKWIVSYVNLYHKALEELVEGHREVTRNHDTILDDGETVSQKLEKFQNRLSDTRLGDYSINKSQKK
jgi:hypothetical protein